MDFLWQLTGACLCLVPSSQANSARLDQPVLPSGCSLASIMSQNPWVATKFKLLS